MRRGVAAVARVAEAAAVHVIIVTGHYVKAMHGAGLARQSVDEITASMLSEL
jgi:predicted metal-dependent phosphotriesterase family hydrolase